MVIFCIIRGMKELLKLSKEDLFRYFSNPVKISLEECGEDESGRYMVVCLEEKRFYYKTKPGMPPLRLLRESLKIPFDNELFFTLLRYKPNKKTNAFVLEKKIVELVLNLLRRWEEEYGELIVATLKALQALGISSDEYMELQEIHYPYLVLNLDKNVESVIEYDVGDFVLYVACESFVAPVDCRNLRVYGHGSVFKLELASVDERAEIDDFSLLTLSGNFHHELTLTNVFDLVSGNLNVLDLTYIVDKGEAREFKYLDFFNEVDECSLEFCFKDNLGIKLSGENITREDLMIKLGRDVSLELRLKSQDLIRLIIEGDDLSNKREFLFDIEAPLEEFGVDANIIGKFVVENESLLKFFKKEDNVIYIEPSSLKDL